MDVTIRRFYDGVNRLPAWAWGLCAGLGFATTFYNLGCLLHFDGGPCQRLAVALSGCFSIALVKRCAARMPDWWRGRVGDGIRQSFVAGCILLVLAAVLFPVFAKARSSSSCRSDASKLKQIEIGFLQYAQDYDELLPPPTRSQGELRGLISPYMSQQDRGGRLAVWTSRQGEFFVVNPAALGATRKQHPDYLDDIIFAYVPYVICDGDGIQHRLAIFLSGHIQSLSEPRFRTLLHRNPTTEAIQ